MATLKPGKGKAKAAPNKASTGPGTYTEAVNPPNQIPPADAPIQTEAEIKAEQELILKSEQLTSIAVTETGAEFAPGISMMPALKIAASLAPYVKQVKKMNAAAARAVIDSTEKYQKGLQFLQTAKLNADQLETYRKSVKGPIDDYGKYIQSLFLPLINGLKLDTNKTGAYHVVATKMLAFKQAEDAKAQKIADEARAKQQEEAQKLAQEEAAKGNKEVAQAIVDAAAAAPAPQVQSSVTNVSVGGFKASTRKVWTGKVATPFDVLRAILEGKVSLSVIDWSQSGLNEYARDTKVAGISNGIECTEVESLGTRG